jgi:hypothetical protein
MDNVIEFPFDSLTSYSSMTTELFCETFEYYYRRGNKLFFRNSQETLIFNTDDFIGDLKRGSHYHIIVKPKYPLMETPNDGVINFTYSVE